MGENQILTNEHKYINNTGYLWFEFLNRFLSMYNRFFHILTCS